MIAVDSDLTTIRMTRGDTTSGLNNKLSFCCPYIDGKTGKEELYEIKPDDKISFVVFEKKGYTKNEVLRKDYTLRELGYVTPSTNPEIPLSDIDTKKFPLTNKPVTYWYDIVINDTNTVIGYDENGSKKIIVYPEADEE